MLACRWFYFSGLISPGGFFPHLTDVLSESAVVKQNRRQVPRAAYVIDLILPESLL